MIQENFPRKGQESHPPPAKCPLNEKRPPGTYQWIFQNHKYIKHFQRGKKKKTVREEQKFRMALNFSSATLQLEDNDACLQNSRENESQSKDCTPTQTWLCPAGITLICNMQVLKNVTSRYIWLESCWRICYNWGCILRGRNTESQETNSLHRSPAKKNPQRYSYRATPQDESRLKRSRGDPRKDIRRNRTVFQNKANITEGGYVAELLELQARLTIL